MQGCHKLAATLQDCHNLEISIWDINLLSSTDCTVLLTTYVHILCGNTLNICCGDVSKYPIYNLCMSKMSNIKFTYVEAIVMQHTNTN